MNEGALRNDEDVSYQIGPTNSKITTLLVPPKGGAEHPFMFIVVQLQKNHFTRILQFPSIDPMPGPITGAPQRGGPNPFKLH